MVIFLLFSPWFLPNHQQVLALFRSGYLPLSMKANSCGGHKTWITNTETEFSSSHLQYIQQMKGVKTVKASGQLSAVQSEKTVNQDFKKGIPQLPYFTFLCNRTGHLHPSQQDPSHKQAPMKQQEKHRARELQHYQKTQKAAILPFLEKGSASSI